MEVTVDTGAMGDRLKVLIPKSRTLTLTTVGGEKINVFEPIVIGSDYIAFALRASGNETTIVHWDAIASIMGRP